MEMLGKYEGYGDDARHARDKLLNKKQLVLTAAKDAMINGLTNDQITQVDMILADYGGEGGIGETEPDIKEHYSALVAYRETMQGLFRSV